MTAQHPLETKVAEHLLGLGLPAGSGRLVVALSGGCDSVVLLYLLRFPLAHLGFRVTAAHLDHNMRAGSAGDAAWVAGLCAAWGVPLRSERLARPPRSEADARDARYAFLRRCAAAADAELVATAHHADDQAETVLFRAVRGTGLRGLAGIPALTDRMVRPLLPVWRRELEGYARDRGIAWRTDETNAGLEPARNRIRHQILPSIERTVSASARRNLVSLAAIAGEAEAALERMARAAEAELVRWDEGAPSLARNRLHLYDSAVTSRVLRNLLRHFGVVPGRTGTRRALQFITDAHSGRQMPLSGTLRIEIEFDRARFVTCGETSPDVEHVIEAAEAAGEARLRIGGAAYRLLYGPEVAAERVRDAADGWTFRGDPAELAFPLRLRGWRDGDRLGSGGRRRSLKKVFLEQRVPRERRRKLPLLVDSTGKVIWVAGLGSRPPRSASQKFESFVLKVLHD